MLTIILIVLIVLALGGGGWGYSRFGIAGFSPLGLLLLVLLVLWLLRLLKGELLERPWVAQLRAGDFDKAAMAFGAFQARWPASGYGASARYWQGNALYGKRDYKGAIDAFRAFLAKAPDNERASEAMLAIANSQAEMKDKAGARKTLDELIKAYPKSEAAIAGKERLAALK